MPTTLEKFLALEPTLAAMRRASDSSRSDTWRISGAEAAMVGLLTRRWDRGLAGWLTAAEAAELAAELTTDASHRRADARAGVRGEYLVFSGGRHGEQLLHLTSTNPIRARREWACYLQTCPPVREPPRHGCLATVRRWLLGGRS